MDILESSGVGYTQNRLKVLEIIGNSSSPLSASEIFMTMKRTHQINRVTLYRILDILVGSEVVERISAGDRSFRYGLAANTNHPRHPHFFCTNCGNMECLNPESLPVDVQSFQETFPALIQKMEIRLDGICKNCLRRRKDNNGSST
jgi:Fur family ferric uptake transcriptional regulator